MCLYVSIVCLSTFFVEFLAKIRQIFCANVPKLTRQMPNINTMLNNIIDICVPIMAKYAICTPAKQQAEEEDYRLTYKIYLILFLNAFKGTSPAFPQ